MKCTNLWLLGAVLFLAACAHKSDDHGENDIMDSTSFTLTAAAFTEAAPIPVEYACEGADRSPALEWSDVPDSTRSFALTCIDPDAPMGDWVHWLAWDIPGDRRELPAGIDAENQDLLRQGRNSWRRSGYGGPCPPKGQGPHRYFFRLYALDVETLEVASPGARKQLETALDGHVLGGGQVMGTYERK